MITAKAFEELTAVPPRVRKRTSEILQFLADNKDNAYTSKELWSILYSAGNKKRLLAYVRTTLSFYKKAGLVDYKFSYYKHKEQTQ